VYKTQLEFRMEIQSLQKITTATQVDSSADNGAAEEINYSEGITI
jgi:hypothetical protein